MTKEQFEQTAYNGKITYETYQQCDCTECKRECIHREAYRRMGNIPRSKLCSRQII